MSTKRVLKVVCGLIEKDGEYLIVQRPEGVMYATLWEFPGGKVEEEETYEEALIRELKEELDIEVEVLEALEVVEKDLPYLIIDLLPYHCRIIGGEIKLLEHLAMKWVAPKTALDVTLCDGDVKIFEQL